MVENVRLIDVAIIVLRLFLLAIRHAAPCMIGKADCHQLRILEDVRLVTDVELDCLAPGGFEITPALAARVIQVRKDIPYDIEWNSRQQFCQPSAFALKSAAFRGRTLGTAYTGRHLQCQTMFILDAQ